MDVWIETLMVLLILSNILLLGVSSLNTCIRVVALQGILLGVFTFLAQADDITLRIGLFAIVSTVLKAIIFPACLFRAIREAGVRREIEPFVGYASSIAAGIVMLAISQWINLRLPIDMGRPLPLVVPTSLMTMFTGLFLIVTRKKALTQALGYLVFENGIYAFGIATAGEIPIFVEFGVLLDVFVAVFVMGIVIYHINREFDHIDTDRLSSLKG